MSLGAPKAFGCRPMTYFSNIYLSESLKKIDCDCEGDEEACGSLFLENRSPALPAGRLLRHLIISGRIAMTVVFTFRHRDSVPWRNVPRKPSGPRNKKKGVFRVTSYFRMTTLPLTSIFFIDKISNCRCSSQNCPLSIAFSALSDAAFFNFFPFT